MSLMKVKNILIIISYYSTVKRQTWKFPKDFSCRIMRNYWKIENIEKKMKKRLDEIIFGPPNLSSKYLGTVGFGQKKYCLCYVI